MFRKKEKPKRDHTGKSLAQYGLFEIPSDFDTGLGHVNDDDDERDSDLEAELAAIAGGGVPTRPKRKGSAKLVSQGEIDAMAAESLRDIPSDDEISVDENDPDLLGELNEITGEENEEESSTSEQVAPQKDVGKASGNISEILSHRLMNYEVAEKNAKQSGETSKARRYGRAIKTLKSFISQAQKGTDINLDDDTIPPDIHISDKKPSNQTEEDSVSKPSRPAPAIPTFDPTLKESVEDCISPDLPQSVKDSVEEKKKDIDSELLNMLVDRQKEYKIAALKAKKSGETEIAVKFVKISKQFDLVIEAVQNGQPVDLSQMPGPPGETPPISGIEENQTQKSSLPEITVPEEAANLPEPILITGSTILEALEQRLAVYKEHESKAKQEGNSSKARRYGRIIKQFEDAIKLHKAGKHVAYDELPTPPGYGPIPVEGSTSGAESKPASEVKPTLVVQPPQQPESSGESSSEGPKSSPNKRITGNHVSTSHADKQVLILLAKQKQFKQAALNAKQQGELNEAKEFLKQAKGFDRLIEAARAGLPVDWSSIPVSPEAKSQLDNEYDIVMTEGLGDGNKEDLDLLARLEIQLQKQLKMCLTTRDHNKALGDVAGTNRFERLALNVTKDLDVVRVARRMGSVPKFHYEMKDFSIVKSFTEILENTMEVTIHRGINYQSGDPKSIDTYVKFDFPFPQDTPYSGKTSTIRDTNNPEYEKTFVIPIQRNSRQCQRVFKRQGIKFEVYSKGGFFRGDTLIGTVSLKLQQLETQCEIHDSFDLMDGRKKVGGKLEIQVRLRTPLLTQQVEKVQEKWLVIAQ